MKPIILFIFGLILGFICAIALFFLASQKYMASIQSAENGQISNAQQLMQEAQTLWPLYRLDAKFQRDLSMLQEMDESSGVKITILLKNDATENSVESLINQLEVMDGVAQVEWNTLSQPRNYITNLSRLPESTDEIRDYITVTMENGESTEKIAEFASFQDSVYKISGKN